MYTINLPNDGISILCFITHQEMTLMDVVEEILKMHLVIDMHFSNLEISSNVEVLLLNVETTCI